jgi:uncharacterized protein (TIGR00251 family)
VTPHASKNEIVEVLSDGTIKIRLTAPPVDGKANDALLKFLAKILKVPITSIDILAGAGGRDKLISVKDMDAAIIQKKIVEHIR